MLKIGTRKSKLALTQTDLFCQKLDQSFEIIPFQTTGDLIQDKPLYEIGGKGLFSKQLHQSVFDGSIDCAVHSLKDLECPLPDGIIIGCVLEREDPRDALILPNFPKETQLKDIPKDVIIGTCSPRRRAQILFHNPFLTIEPLRGNVETRLNKTFDNKNHGTILAVSGLKRLGLQDVITTYLDPKNIMIPAAGQGAIAITCRDDNHALLETLHTINHQQTFDCITKERAYVHSLNGNCQTPIGAWAYYQDAHNLHLHTYYFDGTNHLFS